MYFRAVMTLAAWTLALASAARAQNAPDPRTARACKTELAGQLQALDVPGLVAAIVKHGRIACTAAAGMADIEQGRAATADTLFLVASVSKTVTGAAILQLHEQGRFRLDEDVSRFLSFRIRVPSAPIAPITFRQLLTHSASIKDNPAQFDCPGSCAYGSAMGPAVTRGADSPIALADFVRGYLTPGGAFYDRSANFEAGPPGTVNEYSNMSLVLAGYLVEAISGVPFDRYCRDNIFAPLGMRLSAWRLADIDRALVAVPYDKSPAGYVPYGQYGEPNYPDGMLRTSANELARFLIAHMQEGRLDGRAILRPSTVEQIFTSQTPLDPAQGLVWYSQSIGRGAAARTVWGHDGADFGARARMWFDPATGRGVILLSNGMWKDAAADALLARLFQEADGY
jgi:CubicO group peptidase (beta-lactamase class C family)